MNKTTLFQANIISYLIIRMQKVASARGMNLYPLSQQMGYQNNIFSDIKNEVISLSAKHIALAAFASGNNPEWLEKGIEPIVLNDLKPNHVELPKMTESALSKTTVSPQKRKRARDKKTSEHMPPLDLKKGKLG